MVAVGILALGAGSASAATVRTEEQTGETNRATLVFQAAPGERNEVTVTRGETTAGLIELSVRDAGASVEAGPGCQGGGGLGSTALCTMHAPRAPEQVACGKSCVSFVPGSGWTDSMAVDLGDGDNSFDGSSFSAKYSEGFVEDVRSGSGADTILTGGADDRIEPGAGDDVVHAGDGHDTVVAGATHDGTDLYDLGEDNGNVADYSARTEPLAIGPEGGGAPGEGDRFEHVNIVLSGSGADTLTAGGALYQVQGGAGNDTITTAAAGPYVTSVDLIGGDGDDTLRGGAVLSRFIGGEGNDTMFGGTATNIFLERKLSAPNSADNLSLGSTTTEPSLGDDVAVGGPNNDLFFLGGGNDQAEGGGGDDEIYGEDGDDSLAGGSGNDIVAGERGSDRLEGDEGDDQLLSGRLLEYRYGTGSRAMDGWSDSVDCGPGNDFSDANPWDRATGCEKVQSTRVVDNGRIVRLRNGAAKMVVDVAGPGQLTISGSGVRPRSLALAPVQATGAHSALVRISPRGAAARRLHRHGHAIVRLRVRFAPEGGLARTETRAVKLVRRR